MNFLKHLSIRKKLVGIILIATLLSLGSGFTVAMMQNLRLFEEDLVRTTELIARTVADYASIYLVFDEKLDASRSLAQLARFDYVTDAHLYDLEGRLFASYRRYGNVDVPTALPADVCEVRDGFLHCSAPAVFEGERYGTIYLRGTAEPLRERARELLSYLATLMAVLVAVAVILAWFLQALVSGPILHLAEQTQKISAEGDYSIRVEKPAADEIGVLYDGFNDMLSQVERRQAELERSNRDLDQFAYVASHDLKAPLRAISTLAGWIEEDLEPQLSGEARQQLELLRRRVARMDGLIEGILQYSRAGRVGTDVERVDVGELLRELVELQAPPPGITVEVAPGMPVLEARRLRLEQVFANLLDNAIKHHHRPAGGRIEIRAERRGEAWAFTVEDDGPGIAAEHQERVFRMFQTLTAKDRDESTGLGLALVKKLIEEEGGTITLESTPGAGCRFRFTWPATARTEDERSPAGVPGDRP